MTLQAIISTPWRIFNRFLEASPLDQRIPQINIQGVSWPRELWCPILRCEWLWSCHVLFCCFTRLKQVTICDYCFSNQAHTCFATRKSTFCKIRSEKQIVACPALRFVCFEFNFAACSLWQQAVDRFIDRFTVTPAMRTRGISRSGLQRRKASHSFLLLPSQLEASSSTCRFMPLA